MNSKKDDNNKREVRNRIDRLSDALTGEPEDIGLEEAEELLRCADIEPDTLSARLYKSLYQQAQQYWTASKPLPPLLKKALNDLRPLTEPPRTEVELGKQAKARVEQIVEQARGLPFLGQVELPQFQPSAFRNKKGLTNEDRSLLDALASEMNDETPDSDEGNET
jgi:hypothetical protein